MREQHEEDNRHKRQSRSGWNTDLLAREAAAGAVSADIKVRLSDFLGKKVVLFFYPQDNAPDCTHQACDARPEKKLYGKISMGVVHSTCIIDENGMIERVMPKAKPNTNAAVILEHPATLR